MKNGAEQLQYDQILRLLAGTRKGCPYTKQGRKNQALRAGLAPARVKSPHHRPGNNLTNKLWLSQGSNQNDKYEYKRPSFLPLSRLRPNECDTR
ncbi:hypothetical protein LZ24_02714 [Desulfobotulus alkaliphilus]|uniref:Uncharacterized protein n=1 Tax=Desulfobotulus alkaliphilus TaxID=622671 RepID=A0A562RFE2_9BACT|nr:hypothetical protein LZ24_02714 [Desulfobotulus alkaliphilus]